MNAIIVASILLAACAGQILAAPGGYGHSYSAPSYSSYSAPSYSAPSYSAPSYSAPSYSAPAPVYGQQSYAYPSPAPSVRCGSNLLVGCAPSVAHVPCSSYSPPSYSAPSYGAPSYGAPSYGKAY